ncbi:MAG: hypothetical protein COT00_00115 [Candidatus Omnitrophica bacterium CG07_land_8_20_14_0_80_50_8]|nr:MAG: hypothetical protein COT00_00115 [Candidatus Omnitrophica bacterium CG07_land_8_20_14_0_80_50_8]
MVETVSESPKKPGIVIFVSILNFFSAALWFLEAAFFVVLLIFGNAISVTQAITDKLRQGLASQNLSLGLNAVFSFFLIVGVLLGVYHLLLGIGLQKGKGAAWYVQIVTAIVGLILIPYGTIVSIVILVLFFQSGVRNYFKV